MTEIKIDWTAEPRYRYKNNLTIWTKIGEGTRTWGGAAIVYLKSPGGAYRYPTLRELERDYKELTDDVKIIPDPDPVPTGPDEPLPEADAMPDEAFELGRVAGSLEGFDAGFAAAALALKRVKRLQEEAWYDGYDAARVGTQRFRNPHREAPVPDA